ncbi:MAG: cob(I)yrinic acid a,c-diamide adenosyltransferase [Lachnospiraceae bacterium]|nr:cob(I)yrinic acid a,c-diamide adenosyltransferase [Lachnospiraceae bacterium]
MNIYTKKGDFGQTSLGNGSTVLKTDDRIELLGIIDELNSQIGLAKVAAESWMQEELSHIQRTLMLIMAGIADSLKREYKLQETEIQKLEEWIDRIEGSFVREKGFVLYGGCELSARLDVARAVARRAERQFHRAARHYPTDKKAMCYMNRLSDYLYMCARFADYLAG